MEKSIYQFNEVMRVIGCQNCAANGIYGNDFKAALDAHKRKNDLDPFNMALDFYLLGVIYGKKAERAKKNHTAVKEITNDAQP